MIEAHLPGNLFQAMACEDYADESEDVLSRASGIVVEMMAGGTAPNDDTYRRVLFTSYLLIYFLLKGKGVLANGAAVRIRRNMQ